MHPKTAGQSELPNLSVIPLQEHFMRPLRYSINLTLDGCCDHRAILPDEELHRHAVDTFNRADVLLFGRVTYDRGAGIGQLQSAG
jgi:hypothetical protein